jgi:hypothetical protein
MSAELVSALYAAGDPLAITAANALLASRAEASSLRARVEQLEAIARLNAETICTMQRASACLDEAHRR